MYRGEYDLAGFCVGVVEKDRIIDGRSITPGDVVLGLASSGPHSNGYSLIRRIIGEEHLSSELTDSLMEPTRIYVKPVLKLAAAMAVKGLAHITGGGLVGNVPRVLPKGTKAVLDKKKWPRHEIFRWLQHTGTSRKKKCFACSIAASGSSSWSLRTRCRWPRCCSSARRTRLRHRGHRGGERRARSGNRLAT